MALQDLNSSAFEKFESVSFATGSELAINAHVASVPCPQLFLFKFRVDHIVVAGLGTGGLSRAFGGLAFVCVHVLSQGLRCLHQFITCRFDRRGVGCLQPLS